MLCPGKKPRTLKIQKNRTSYNCIPKLLTNTLHPV
jgi:hypothetical protein